MILFISMPTLKSEYLLDDNLDENYILPIIVKCQDFIIKPLLGDTLYSTMKNQISGGTLSETNKVLLEDYIHPIIGYFVQSEVVYATAYKLKNQGLENGDSNRFNELVKISSKYMNDCNQYQQIFREYVCEEGISTLPEKETVSCSIFFPSKSQFRNPNELPGRK